VTSDEYRAAVRGLGLTPCRPSFNGSTLHQTRDGGFQQVPNPEILSEVERPSMIALITWRLGVETH
jgi:hypothetical protein